MARDRWESTASTAEGEEMTSEIVEEEGEASSDSLSEPDVDLSELETLDDETEDEEEEAAAALEAEAVLAAAAAAAARCNDGLASQLGNGGVILVLFEMPSGFAIFRYDGVKLLLPDACQNIWADFVDDAVTKDVVRLLDTITFEDKDSAINEDTGVSEALAKMIGVHTKPGQKLAVGNLDYKKIIESNMDIECLWCPAVEELMWGLKISMGNFVPAERSGLTNEDRLRMSQGMESFLKLHSFDIKPDMMVTKDIIQMAGSLNQCHQYVNKYKYFLLDAAEPIMKICNIDTNDWDLLKLATALMMICCPEEKIAAPQWLFTREQFKIFRKHAPQYNKNKVLKMPLSVAYNEIYLARQLRNQVTRQLLRLIKHDKKAYEAELASEGMMSHQQQMAPPSRGSVNGFPNPKLGRELVQVFAKDEESSYSIFDDTDPSVNIQTNNVSQATSDDSSNKPFSVVENRLEELSQDCNENFGKRKVQPENNLLSGGGTLLISEGLDGPPSSSHAYEPSSSAPETRDSTVSVKYPSAVDPVTSSQRPGSSASERIAANSFSSAPGEKSTMNPNAEEFKLNPNANSFTPLATLRSLHPPASDISYYYPNNMPAALLGPGLPVGMGFPPAYGGQGYMHPAGPQEMQQYRGRNF